MNICGTEVAEVSNPYGKSAAPIDADYFDQTPSLIVKGKWNSGIADYINENEIKGLYLNYTKGFKCDNFDFLNQLSFLESLNIIYTPVVSLSQIEGLKNLNSLSISCHWKNELDLSSLHKLKRCFISYDKGAESIFECDSLHYLYIDNFKLKDYSKLDKLKSVEYLSIANSTFQDTEFLGNLSNLRKLVLLNCRNIEKLNGLNKLSNLEWLTIDGSKKISSIDKLSSLISLKVLQLSNNKEIDTLSAIKNLYKLKALSFNGDTVFKDGDFYFLELLNSLTMVSFAGRRHYTHKPAKSWSWADFNSNVTAVVSK